MIKKYWPQVVLYLLVLIISLTNYSSDTWLSGWDNLHPEFNFWLNIKRSIFAVWQEYQGLGLLGGMGHAADLPRQIFLWITSVFVPQNFIRYFYHFLMLFIGPLGVYFLLKDIILERFSDFSTSGEYFAHPRGVFSASLIGAIFYLFNLATVQMFYVPFEPYSAHFGFLPWLFWANLNYLKKGNKKSLIILFITNFLSVPQGYVATFFLVYLMSLSILLIQLIWNRKYLVRILVIFLLTFIVNAYWLLPNVYYVYKKADVTISAKINQLSTEDNLLRNRKYGTITDTILLKGFWLDNVEMDKEGLTRYQFEDWKKYFDNQSFKLISYILFGLSLTGVLYSLMKKIKEAIVFIPVLFLSFTVLANGAPFFSFFSSIFYKLPLFSQIFRFPYTKFAILTAFNYSIFFALGCMAVVFLIDRIINRKVIFFALSVIPIIYLYPIVNGGLFYNKNKAEIPYEYFQVFNYFKKQNKNERIANFPQYTFWGWNFYRWNYSGSGFLWYGIEQPILDRAFDVWSREDENYYWEISQAVYSGNQKLFESLLEKYQISWLLVDDNVLTYSSAKALYLTQLKEILDYSTKVKLAESFGKIKIYQVELDSKPKDFIFFAENLPVIRPAYKWNNYDKGYEEYGTYLTQNSNLKAEESKETIYYPFRTLFTGRKQDELEFGIKDNTDNFSFTAKIPTELVGAKLVIPEIKIEEVSEIDSSDQSKVSFKYPEVYLDGELIQSEVSLALPYIREGNLEVRVPKIQGYYSYNLQPFDFAQGKPKTCDGFNKGEYKHDLVKEDGEELLRLTSLGSSNCLDFDLPNLTQRLGYLITVENRNVEGKSLLFAVINKNSQRADLETYLPKSQPILSTSEESWLRKLGLPPSEVSLGGGVSTAYFVVPPMEQFATGYTLHLDNISIGRVKTVNDLGRITVNPIPYRFLTGLKIVKDSSDSSTSGEYFAHPRGDLTVSAIPEVSYRVEHPNPSFYQVSLDSSTVGGVPSDTSEVSLGYLVLSQSFDEGWRAYKTQCQNSNLKCQIQKILPFFFAKEIKDHVLVNNWENGWFLQPTTNNPQPTTVILVYLPQYLEYIGFGLLLITPLFLLVSRRKFV